MLSSPSLRTPLSLTPLQAKTHIASAATSWTRPTRSVSSTRPKLSRKVSSWYPNVSPSTRSGIHCTSTTSSSGISRTRRECGTFARMLGYSILWWCSRWLYSNLQELEGKLRYTRIRLISMENPIHYSDSGCPYRTPLSTTGVCGVCRAATRVPSISVQKSQTKSPMKSAIIK